MSTMATHFAYNCLHGFILLALLFSLLPVLPAIQNIVTSACIARNEHVRKLIVNVETKDARIGELENQIQQQRKEKASIAAQHESEVKKERSVHAKELAQLSMQLSDANAMVSLEQTTNKSLRLRMENQKQEEKPRQAPNLRAYTRHTEHVKKIREEHAVEVEAMRSTLKGKHQEEIKAVVPETETRVKQEVKATLDAAVEANRDRYLRSRIALLEKRAAQHNSELSRKHRECKDRIKYEAISLESRCNDKLKVVQDESDLRQQKVEMLEERLRSSIVKSQALQSELDQNHRDMVPKSAVTTLEARIQELEHIIASKDAKITSERAAASARENELVDTINANILVYEANVAAHDEKIRENINVYRSELVTRDAEAANLNQIIHDKNAQIAELEAKNRPLEKGLLAAEKSQPDTSKGLQQCVNKYKHEKFTSKRYRKEFNKALDKLDRRKDAYGRLKKENACLRTGLKTASENIKTLTQDFNDLSEEVKQAAVEIQNQEWNIRNYGQAFEEQIAELKRKETIPQDNPPLTISASPASHPPPVSPPSSSSHAIEPVGSPADLSKVKSSASSGIRMYTKDLNQTLIPTEIQIKVQSPSHTESQQPAHFPQLDSCFDSNPAGQDTRFAPLPNPFPNGHINEFDDMINWQGLEMAVDPAEVFNLPFPFEQVNQAPDQTMPQPTLPYEPASNGNDIFGYGLPIQPPNELCTLDQNLLQGISEFLSRSSLFDGPAPQSTITQPPLQTTGERGCDDYELDEPPANAAPAQSIMNIPVDPALLSEHLPSQFNELSDQGLSQLPHEIIDQAEPPAIPRRIHELPRRRPRPAGYKPFEVKDNTEQDPLLPKSTAQEEPLPFIVDIVDDDGNVLINNKESIYPEPPQLPSLPPSPSSPETSTSPYSEVPQAPAFSATPPPHSSPSINLPGLGTHNPLPLRPEEDQAFSDPTLFAPQPEHNLQAEKMAAQEALRTDKDDDDVSWEDVPLAPISNTVPQANITTDDALNPSDIDAENNDFYGHEALQNPPTSPNPASSQPPPPPVTSPSGVEVSGRGKKRTCDMGDGVEGPAWPQTKPLPSPPATGTSTSDEPNVPASARSNATPQQFGVEDDNNNNNDNDEYDVHIPTPEEERADMLRSGWDPDEDYTPINRNDDDVTGEDRTENTKNDDGQAADQDGDIDESGLTEEEKQHFEQQRRETRDLHLQYLKVGGDCPDDCGLCGELRRAGRI